MHEMKEKIKQFILENYRCNELTLAFIYEKISYE